MDFSGVVIGAGALLENCDLGESDFELASKASNFAKDGNSDSTVSEMDFLGSSLSSPFCIFSSTLTSATAVRCNGKRLPPSSRGW